MSKKRNFWDDFRFEFNLYINDNIICQRLFDVKNFNKEVLHSVELKEMMDSLTGINNDSLGQMGIIPSYFKELCRNVSWRKYKPYKVYDNKDSRSIFENEDKFTFEIKVDKKVVARSEFSGNWFQTDVRYAVNIKEIIPEIISEIDYYMSRKEYTTVYNGQKLALKSA